MASGKPMVPWGSGSYRSRTDDRPLRTFVLQAAMILSGLGVVAALAMSAVSLFAGVWLLAFLVYPLSAIYSMAMCYVFSNTLRPD